MAIEHLIFPSGPLGANTGLLWCSRTHEGILIDPAGEPEEILDLVLRESVALRAILLTHGHFDHAGAVATLKEQTSADIYLHPGDEFLWNAMDEQCRAFGFPPASPPPPDEMLSEGQSVSFGREKLVVWHLPGHSPGSVGFHSAESALFFCGDLCFARGVGRTDLWGGSEEQLQRSLVRLRDLPANTQLIPGHGPGFGMSRLLPPTLRSSDL